MAIQLVNVGTYPNDGTGDDINVAFQKINNSIIALNNLVAKLESDTAPKLGGNLNLNGYHISNGDIQATIYGYDFLTMANLVNALMFNNSLSVDLGGITTPNEVNLDLGTFAQSPQNSIDFGYIILE